MTSTAALCATLIYTVGDLWFSTDPRDRGRAKAICRRCPIREACAQAGLDAGYKARGVWGGLSSGDRRTLRTGLAGPDPDDEGEAARVPVLRERRPCGDQAAYMAHRRYQETVDEACAAAHAAWVLEQRRALLAKHHAAGGTSAGRKLHHRLGEPACPECREADRVERRASRARVEEARRAHSALRAVPAGQETPGAHAGAQAGVGAAA